MTLVSVLISAVLALAAGPPTGVHPLAWVALAPFLLVVRGAASRRTALAYGAVYGLVHYGLFFRWILAIPYPIAAWFLFSCAAAAGVLFGVGVAFGVHLTRGRPAWVWVPAFPLLWSLPALIADNPWRPFLDSVVLLSGVHAPLPLPFLQLARPFGETGLAAFVSLMNALAALAWEERASRSRAAAVLAGAAVLMASAWAWGSARVRRLDANAPLGPSFRVACAQHDLPFAWDWRTSHHALIYETYDTMAREAVAKGARLVVFPQYQLPEDVLREPQRWGEIARRHGVYLAFGTYSPLDPSAPGKEAWVVSLVISPEGRIVGSHRALHPSPVGRPMVVPGEDASPISVPSLGELAFLPCYDDVAPAATRLSARAGASVLADIANDGPFEGGTQPELHLMRARLRAVESGLEMVRCTPNGISAFIDAAGRVSSALPAGKGLIFRDLPGRVEPR